MFSQARPPVTINDDISDDDSDSSDGTFEGLRSPPSTDNDPDLYTISATELHDLSQEVSNAELKFEKSCLSRRLQHKKDLVQNRRAELATAHENMLEAQDVVDGGPKQATIAVERVNQWLAKERAGRAENEKVAAEEAKVFRQYEAAQDVVANAPINSAALDKAVEKVGRLGKKLDVADVAVRAARDSYDVAREGRSNAQSAVADIYKQLKQAVIERDNAVAAMENAKSNLEAAKNAMSNAGSELKKVLRKLEGI